MNIKLFSRRGGTLHGAFRALADPSRRRVLALLRERSRKAGELSSAVPLGKPTLSHHLAVLSRAGLVRCARRGRERIYSVNTSVVEDVGTAVMELLRPAGGATPSSEPARSV